ncbi:hypothetical protein FOCC_FOCC011497 [Frankliniella occidentalis]|nr:hypothetical protein FOCC_FOCC011497 [Frankliniella occidentalis]
MSGWGARAIAGHIKDSQGCAGDIIRQGTRAQGLNITINTNTTMKAVFVLVVALAALAAVSEASPVATKERKTKPLSEVLQEGKVVVRMAAEAAPEQPAGARGLAACYEPGCNYQCSSYGYAGGYCQWGKCLCWYW